MNDSSEYSLSLYYNNILPSIDVVKLYEGVIRILQALKYISVNYKNINIDHIAHGT